MTTLVLPWPPKELSPNVSSHWAAKGRLRKKLRSDCYMLAYAAGVKPQDGVEGYSIGLIFCPPSGRHFDADNLVARCKGLLDGVADAAGVNDRNFRLEAPVIARPKPPHGEVIVTLSPLASQEAA